ncbi:cobalamin B12-binding domain-containing protein [Nonomuraea zeae]|uniref:cobalamin B12-binding domain-containing protein n=1 Tax=Nonomuraea zeae TaxID=1642303 RepID=UPI001F0E8B36|nr:cobalamin-dependent protein [Nonomuraea zeae]
MADNLEDRVEKVWTAALAGDDHGAADVALAALDDGLPPEDLLLGVLAPVQSRVGDAWAANGVTVAQEHIVTAVSERVLAAVSRHPAARARHTEDKGRATVACVDGEWHAFPARLLAELLRLHGWRVDYLGPHVPTPYLPMHVNGTDADVVALSASMPSRLPAAHAAIAACQETGKPVLAGGAAFGADGRYAHLLGADGWAADGLGAVEHLAGGPLRRRTRPGEAGGHRPPPAGEEFDRISGMAQDVVSSVMWKLGERLPAMAGYSRQQLDHTTKDIGYIVEFLTIALYVRDPELFSRFLLWMAGILTARGVPESTLFPALDLLAGQLKDFPHALATVEHGVEVLGREEGKDRPRHPF